MVRISAQSQTFDRRETCLVLAIVLLGVAQDPVAESQHVLKVSITLVSQILQPQYWPITLICERSLQNTKDLERQNAWSAMNLSMRVLTRIEGQTCVCCHADLGKDILLPHEFLSLSVRHRRDHRQNVLAIVWHHTHKEDQILKKFRHKPDQNSKNGT